MSRQLEFRLDANVIRPLVDHVKKLQAELNDKLATPNAPPEDDQIMSDFWSQDLLASQRKDVAAIVELFDDDFLESGRATVDEEDVDMVLRGCTVVRLKLRESTLSSFEDEDLERGDLYPEELSQEEKSGYSAYILLASLQELIISQIDP